MTPKRSRSDYNWRPDPDDELSYRWNGIYWVVDWEYEGAIDEDALEEWEEWRRKKRAEEQEY